MPVTRPVVFISSTSRDLEPYRDAAFRAARRAGFASEMMEDFKAQSRTPPYAACLEKVDRCDVLVVIVAHRYGSVPPDEVKSITWLECERAHANGKEIFAFVVDDKHPWPVELKESYRLAEASETKTWTPELQAEVTRNIAQLAEFKSWLDSLGFRRTFTDPGNLELEVLDQLADWLQRHPEHQAAPTRDDPTEYLRQLGELTGWIDIRGLQVGSTKAHRFPIGELYIPLTTPGGGSLDNALAARLLVIEGDPGAGKTTFLRRITHDMCTGAAQTQFPLYLRAADLEEHITNCRKHNTAAAPPANHSPQWLAHYFTTQSAAKAWKLDTRFFESKLKSTATTVLLDGLDEASSRVQRESLARLLGEATTAFQCRFVVTTRPAAYTGSAMLAGFEQVRIDDLDTQAIQNFLRQWSKCLYPTDPSGADDHRNALSEALRARPAIRRMARNPVMLTALAVVHWNERRLPEQRADLYESIVTWLARAREQRPGRESSDAVLALLSQLALGMQDQPKGRLTQVSRAAAAEILAPHYRDLPDPDQRLAQAREFLEAEEVDSGIFVARGSDFRFWHLTLQEYLAARRIAGLTDASQQKLLFGGDKLYRPEWREVMLLLGGTLIKQGADKVDALFKAMLDRVAPQAALADRARCVGLLGAMLADLRPHAYRVPGERYQQMLDEVLGIFDADKSRGIDLKVRLAAADALGQAGDPRLRLPKDKDYWVAIPAGEFTMGDGKDADAPKHEVYLDSCLIGRHPVTVHEYALFLDDTGHAAPRDWENQSLYPNRPVVSVSWHDADAYCRWVAETVPGVKLPTEAQWERAARGTEGRIYAWGDAAPSPECANYDQTGVGHPSPVGLFPLGSTPEAPECQITDLSGNVWEWVADWYGELYYGESAKENPAGPVDGASKVLRGGSWVDDGTVLRAAGRYRYLPGSRHDYNGFRCVREVFS